MINKENKKKVREKPAEKVWSEFCEQESLTDDQLEKFKKYEALLTQWNKSMNLTAISGLSETVHRHFADSLSVRKYLDFSKIKLIADVGPGAGFPSIPLKIMFPDLDVVLIEVSNKRQKFLKALITALDLKNVGLCELDWRTFLRTTESAVEYFLVRASLDPKELIRAFKPGCAYKDSKLVYWATADWEPEMLVKDFVKDEFLYKMKRTKRKLVLMGK